uniref:Reverse transcriptase domain-containing protein n=1 Tax=Oryzias melastigma TaxID=30732 RepID=A0A3B3B355_ORYME
MERVGLEELQGDIKRRLAKLRRAEQLRRQRKRKERTRSLFYNNPYSFVKGLFEQEKSGRLITPIKELEEHLKQVYSDDRKHESVTIPSDIPPIHAPKYQMDIRPPTLSEVEKIVRKARAASAPGPNGIPYRLYKNTPRVLNYLWRLMKVVWQKGEIPKAWRRAGGILIPKEKDSSTIGQFRQISLLNVEGKIFFSVLAQRLLTYLQRNNFVDTSVQKAGVQGFSGCLEHTNIIWHQIQTAKKERRDLHVVFLDLANAFGSVPHNILWTAFDYFSVPYKVTELIRNYFQDLQFCVTYENMTTNWQHLEIGIMAGCTISPLAFVMAMEIVIRASRWVVGGEKINSDLRLPPIRAYMDDMTLITTTKPCTRRLLQKLQENIQWARMEFKPGKSRSISVVKGQVVNEQFYIRDEPIPTILEKPIKSLGRWYNADLKDTQQVEQLRQNTADCLKKIDNTSLPGKLKLWCYQFGLLPRLIWPLTMYEVSLSHANRLERLVNSYVRKWLGVPNCLSSVGLYSDGVLSLPVPSLVEEFKCAKVRLDMSLSDSKDPVVRGAAPVLATGRKWTPGTAVLQAKSALRHRDIVGHVQGDRRGFGFGTVAPLWQKASATERRDMVVDEVRQQEEAARRIQAVAQAKQGGWVRWEGVEKRKLTWSELWNMESNRLSFIIRATYDVLPSPANLHLWLGKDPACPLCTSAATLKHILVGCKICLTQGRYTWRHNQVLRCLANTLECKRVHINAQPCHSQNRRPPPPFICEGGRPRSIPPYPELTPLNAARDWQMQVDLDRRLVFPSEIATTTLRPDLVLWSNSCRVVYIIELTVPWEDSLDEAYERKKLRYSDLAAEAEDRKWKVRVRPVEVGCRGFVASSTAKLLREVGIRGRAHRQAIKELTNTTERASQWLWLKRSDMAWTAKTTK